MRKFLSLFCLGLLGLGAASAESGTFELNGTAINYNTKAEEASNWTVTAEYDEDANKLTLSNFTALIENDVLFSLNGNSVIFEFTVDPETGAIAAPPANMTVWFYGYGSADPFNITGSITNKGSGNSTLALDSIALGFFKGSNMISSLYVAEPATLPFRVNVAASESDPELAIEEPKITFDANSDNKFTARLSGTVTSETEDVDFTLYSIGYSIEGEDESEEGTPTTLGSDGSYTVNVTGLPEKTDTKVILTLYKGETALEVTKEVEFTTPELPKAVTMTVTDVTIECEKVSDTEVKTTVKGKLQPVDSSATVDFSDYKVLWALGTSDYATVDEDGVFAIPAQDQILGESYTLEITPYFTATSWVVCGEKFTKKYTAEEVGTGVEAIGVEAGETRYFTLDGAEIANPAPGAICIKVANGKAAKTVIR